MVNYDFTLKELMNKYSGENGRVTFENFCIFLSDKGFKFPLSKISELFSELDKNRDGIISWRDDSNGDGEIDFRETLIRTHQETSALKYGISEQTSLCFKDFSHFKEKELTDLERKVKRIKKGSRPCLDALLYECEVPVDNLPDLFDGYSILHLSDVHFRADRKNLPKRINYLKEVLPHAPDIIAITGDLVSKSPEDLGYEEKKSLENLFPEVKKFFVLGNHDYFPNGQESADKIKEFLIGIGYTNLINTKTKIQIGDSRLNLFGLDDMTEGKPSLTKVEDKEIAEKNILLTHNLDCLNSSLPECFDLVLSGHLHAGEFNFKLFSGIDFLKRVGAYNNLNSQTFPWKGLTWRTLSYISPGLSSHYGRINTDKEGATLLKLRKYDPLLNE